MACCQLVSAWSAFASCDVMYTTGRAVQCRMADRHHHHQEDTAFSYAVRIVFSFKIIVGRLHFAERSANKPGAGDGSQGQVESKPRVNVT